MITLYAFGPAFGLPDPSPFVMKTAMLLKMAGLPYQTKLADPRKGPKGKLPFIRDGEEIVADSTLIRIHLERRYGIDFDAGLSPEQRGVAWAVEKTCEDHLYWFFMHARWMDDRNFERGPAKFFDAAPALVRPFVKAMIRRNIRNALHGQGAGRYTEAERVLIADRGFAAGSAILGEKPYLMGDKPCGADASVFAFVAAGLCPAFETELRTKAESYANLRAYCERLRQQYFPEAS
jgi:glutathione S-transferase